MTRDELLQKYNKDMQVAEKPMIVHRKNVETAEKARLHLLSLFSEVEEALSGEVGQLFDKIAEKNPECACHFVVPVSGDSKYSGEHIFFKPGRIGIQGSKVEISLPLSRNENTPVLFQEITEEVYPTPEALERVIDKLESYSGFYLAIQQTLPWLYEDLYEYASLSSKAASIQGERIANLLSVPDLDSEYSQKGIDIERLCYDLYKVDQLSALRTEYLSSNTIAYHLAISKNKTDESLEDWLLNKAGFGNYDKFLKEYFMDENYMETLLGDYNLELLEAYQERRSEYEHRFDEQERY